MKCPMCGKSMTAPSPTRHYCDVCHINCYSPLPPKQDAPPIPPVELAELAEAAKAYDPIVAVFYLKLTDWDRLLFAHDHIDLHGDMRND